MTAAARTAPVGDLAALRAQGAELAARDRWSRERLLGFQQRRLRELVRHAVSSSPYYREALGPLVRGGDLRLEELPTLRKETLVAEFDRIVTDPELRLARLEEHLAGDDPGSLHLGRYRVFATSGTSGLRALVVYDRSEFDVWVAASLRVFARIGITPATRLAAIGAPNPLHATRQLFASFLAGRTGAPRLSVLTPLDETVDALNAYRPEALVGYPSVAALLAQEQLEGRLRIAPRVVGVGSEVLTEEARGRIREAWGLEPANVYAATETLYLASSTPPHRELHLFEDLAVVEVVDEDDRPVPPGRPGYRVLVTNLVNRAQPLIRYELSDSVTLAEGPDPAGLPYARLAGVDGRSDDVLRFPGRGGGEAAVHPYALRAPFASLPGVRQYQIVQRPGGLLVRLVLAAAAPADAPARAKSAVASALAAAGADPPPIEVAVVDAIERESGHAAKIKLVQRLA